MLINLSRARWGSISGINWACGERNPRAVNSADNKGTPAPGAPEPRRALPSLMLTHYLFTSITRLSVLPVSTSAACPLYLSLLVPSVGRRVDAILFTPARSFCSDYFLFRRVIKLLPSPFKLSGLKFTRIANAKCLSCADMVLLKYSLLRTSVLFAYIRWC